MVETVKWQIPYADRVGLISDISKVLSQWQVNIKSFELHQTDLYIEVENINLDQKTNLEDEIVTVEGVKGIATIEFLPWEEREKQLQAVLYSIGEGIIAVDRKGIITTINPVARKILGVENQDVIGFFLREILKDDAPLLKCLETGKAYYNQEILFVKGDQRIHYITSGRPILDQRGKVIGAVASMKDIGDVHRLVYEVTKPLMTTFEEIIGDSPGLKQAINLAKLVAQGDSTVLLRGESGTGKELFARAIHLASHRGNQPFVPVNCAALPDALLESELFGYTEGAFTGAQKGGKAGLFEFANKGTIFLDEIGEVSPHLQAKLLRVLQEGKVRRIGDTTETSIDVRIITATNRNLEDMIKSGDFRKDLYYRLNVIPVYIPSLRERREDIKILASSYLGKLGKRLGKIINGITEKALAKLERYEWPGNVRELENVLERAIIFCDKLILDDEHIMLDRTYGKTGPQRREDINTTLKESMEQVEREIIMTAVNEAGSIRQAAKNLGVSHTTILNKLKKYE